MNAPRAWSAARRVRIWLASCCAAFLTAGSAAAHSGGAPHALGDLRQASSVDPWLVASVGLVVLLYASGLVRLWKRDGIARGAKAWQVACYAAGVSALLAALGSPLDRLAAELSSAHMVQHMLLVAVSAPLLVVAAPMAAYSWALPKPLRYEVHRVIRSTGIATVWKLLTNPLVAWSLHGVALWTWHAPALYEAALHSPAMHYLEHGSFLVTGLFFWWAVFRTARRAGSGAALAMLFATLVHGGLLAALMTFAPAPWYESYALSTARWGLTPLEDQQLAGLIMWAAGMSYLLLGLVLLALSLVRLERRMGRAPASTAGAGPAPRNGDPQLRKDAAPRVAG